jgi:hypothetical protein
MPLQNAKAIAMPVNVRGSLDNLTLSATSARGNVDPGAARGPGGREKSGQEDELLQETPPGRGLWGLKAGCRPGLSGDGQTRGRIFLPDAPSGGARLIEARDVGVVGRAAKWRGAATVRKPRPRT